MTYDNTNRFSLWPNQKEKESDADFTGTVNIEGREYWINGWKRKPDANPKAPSLSGTIKEKKQAHDQGMQQTRQDTGIGGPAGGPEQFVDDIPF